MSKNVHADSNLQPKLRCLQCDNGLRFVQISDYVAELVDASGNHLDLLHSEIDRWECEECGGEAEWTEVRE